MKIDTSKIPNEGLTQEEDIGASALALGQTGARFLQPIKVRADVFKITNAVTVELSIEALMYFDCSRCLNEFQVDFKKRLRLSYPAEKPVEIIDLNEDIRQEILLAYPLKPLCAKSCQGLCPKCGEDLNKGNCSCIG